MNATAARIPEWRRPVVEVPLTQAFPELGEVKEFRSKVCLFNEDRTKVFDVVSDRYSLIQHGEAVDRIQSGLQEFFGPGHDIKAHVRSIGGGTMIRAEFSLPIPPVRLARNDITEISLTMVNSYNRTTPFLATLGGYRLVCSNGMKVGEKFGAVRARHIGLDDSSLLEQLSVLFSRVPDLKRLWEEWADTSITFDQATSLVIDEFPKKYLDAVLVEDNFPKSMWDFYNNLTRFATHDTKSIQRRMDFDARIARLFYGGYQSDE